MPVPAINADIPDPSLVDTGNGWLIFSTGYANIGIYSSPDLHSWTHLPDAFASFAPWISSDGRFWAPGVTRLDDRWLMYYTAHDRRSGLQCIGVATSANPQGPYVDPSAKPLICQTTIGGSIDPDPFVDDDGSAYLLWKNDGNCCGSPTQLWSQRLNG